MRIKGVHEEQVKNFVEPNYKLKINQIKYFPLGEDGASYIIQTDKGKYFVKIFNKGDIAFRSIRRIKTVIEFLYELNKQRRFSNTPVPILNKNKNAISKMDGRALVVYDFIDGRKPSKEEFKKIYPILGKIFAELHNLSPRKFKGIQKEDLNLRGEKKILRILKDMGKERFQRNSKKSKLQKFLLNEKKVLVKAMNILRNEVKEIKNKEKNYVITHADLHRGNLMVNKDKIYIIDWDGLELALPEKDLMWFSKGESLKKSFENSYKKSLRKKFRLDKQALKFYWIRRLVSDITFFSRKIIYQDTSNKEFDFAMKLMKGEVKHLKELIK